MPPKQERKNTKQQNEDTVTPWYLLPFQCIEYLFYAWLLLVLLESLGDLWGWTVGEHAKTVFFAQLTLLQDDFPELTQQIINQVLAIFDYAQILTSIEFIGVFTSFKPYWNGVVFATIALLARVIMLGSFYPIFLLALFVGLFDGLVVRQRRIAHLDREHVTIHYHSKRLLQKFMLYTGLAWLVLPGLWPIHPIWLLLPCAVIVGMITRLMVSSYKKYL
ncbi:DUF4400 domain-containing protein [Shewanella sp. DC2-4]|jgi:hypothetical protein|uniref:DUF4400 domain-containing protein n=1 Tax=Shewanella TaxID=22 RepID=UPI0002113011|nr:MULTISPECIES: DUF4400 domain-containing protein [Shewanella]AEH16368.1 hypothetical protein Sbal117_4735 [Shewanella baltica OS117]NRD34636.1 DUF4400 domain-containing protein [Shewanella sp. DC2-4]